MNKNTRNSIGALVVALFLLACATGGNSNDTSGETTGNDSSTTSDTSADTDGAAAIGDTVTIAGTDITLTDFTMDVKSSNSLMKPTHGSYATVHVDINVTDGTHMAAASNYTIVADDGTAYTAEAIVAGIDGQLEFQTLNAGHKTAGLIVFDINPALFESGGRIELTEFTSIVATWAL